MTFRAEPRPEAPWGRDEQEHKDHEFIIGRTVNNEPGYPNGFEHDFFETVTPLVEPMDALAGDMEDMEGMDMGDDEHADHSGFMVVRGPGQNATITFTPTSDSVGEWEIGCFEEEGAHLDDGMQGTLTVVDA